MILLTNDDGIDAPGLAAIGRALIAAGHDVLVAAPSGERSGSGTGLGTVAHAAVIPVSEVTVPQLVGARCLAVDAPPALIVRAGCEGVFGPVPDLVVSGINAGHNTGRLILHSGTVGAALTALLYDVPGLALSAGKLPAGRQDTAAGIGVAAARLLLDEAKPVVLNINVPDRDIDDLDGLELGALGRHSLAGLAVHAVEQGVVIERTHEVHGLEGGTDAALVAHGRVAVTVLGRLGEALPIDDAAFIAPLRALFG